jgi:hypothetical protein
VTGDGGGDPPHGDNVRIAILETQVAHIQTALGEIRSDLKKVVDGIAHLPTKQDLFQNTATVVIIGLAIMAITVGGIIGGLAWLEPKMAPAPTASTPAPTPQPIIIEVPAPDPAKPAHISRG